MKLSSVVLLLFILLSDPAHAGVECKREKNAAGETITKCSQTDENLLKVKVEGDEPSKPVADPSSDDAVPAPLAEEVLKPNEATMLDWPCSSSRAPKIELLPEATKGQRKIGISGSYKHESCGNVQLDFPTGLGTVILDCNAVSIRATGMLDLCVVAHDITSRPIDLAKGRVYFRGSVSSSYLNLQMPDDRGSPQRIIIEGFSNVEGNGEMFMRGALRIKGPVEEKTTIKDLTMYSGSLSLENVSAGRITIHKSVKLHLVNSKIHNLRWAGDMKKSKWDYLGPMSAPKKP